MAYRKIELRAASTPQRASRLDVYARADGTRPGLEQLIFEPRLPPAARSVRLGGQESAAVLRCLSGCAGTIPNAPNRNAIVAVQVGCTARSPREHSCHHLRITAEQMIGPK